MKSFLRHRSSIARWLGIVFALSVLGWVLLHIDLRQAWETISKANRLWLLVGLVGFYLSLPLRALRWRILLHEVHGSVPLKSLVTGIFLGWFVNCAIPGRAGDLYSTYYIRDRHGLGMSATAGTVFITRVFDILVLVTLFAGIYFLQVQHSLPADIRTVANLAFAATLVLVVGVVVLIQSHELGQRWLPRRIAGIHGRFVGASKASLSPKLAPAVLGLTIALWLLEVFRLGCVLRAVGVEPSLAWLTFLALSAAVLTLLPVTPGGLGTVELLYREVFPLASIPNSVAGAVILLDRFINYWFILLVGALIVVARAGRIPGLSRGRDVIQ